MLFQLNKLGNRGNNEGNPTLTQASGEAFPVWNTIAGKDKVDRLSIYGRTVQPGIPKPDAPAQFQSAGDSGLILTVAPARDGGSGQTFSFGDIVLRSLPSGVRDEIVYENGVWKHIQRVFEYNTTGRESTSGGMVTGNNRITGWISVPAKTTTQHIASNRFVQDSSVSTPNPQSGKMTLHANGSFIYVGLPLDATEPGNLAQWFADNPTVFLYPLDKPIETALNLPAIPTFAGETWFMTNQAEVKPRMSAKIKVKKAEEYIKDGMILWARFDDKTNSDADRGTVKDLSGSGNDFQLKNFAFEPGSGYEDGCLKFDGVDDFLMGKNKEIGTVQMTVKDVNPEKIANPIKYLFGGYDTTYKYVVGICAYPSGIGAANMDKYRSEVIPLLPFQTIFFRTADSIAHQFESCVGTYRDNLTYCIDMKLYEVVLYSTVLTAEQVQHNQKVSQQKNGVENLHGVDFPQTGLLGLWDVVGKTNEDAKRATLENKVADSLNLYLNNFAFIEGSGYQDGYLKFDGVDDYVSTNLRDWGSSEKTVFIVTAPFEAAQTRAFTFLGGDLTSISASGRIEFMSDTNAGYSVIQSPLGCYDFSKPHIVCFTRKGLSARGFLDGNLIGESVDFKDHGWLMYLCIGGVTSRGFPFNFISAMLYSRSLSNPEIIQITNFLKQKYGI